MPISAVAAAPLPLAPAGTLNATDGAAEQPHLAWGGIDRTGRVRYRSGIVHARDHHLRDISRRIWRVYRKARVVEAVEDAPLVGVHAAHLVTRVVADGDRQVGRREL